MFTKTKTISNGYLYKVKTNLEACYFTQLHAHYALVPTFDHLSQSYLELEWLLPWILGAPKLLGEVPILAESCTLHCNSLATSRLGSCAWSNQLLLDPHLCTTPNRCCVAEVFEVMGGLG
jgi:hypothetical protein